MGLLRPSEIRALRIKLGLTQARLAELAGVTQAYVAKIEAGDADPKASTLERLSAVLARGGEERPLTAERIMASPIVSVRRADTVGRAAGLMKSLDISQLPVLEGARQIGSISETTLMRKVATGESVDELAKSTVGGVMEDPFPTVGKDTAVDTIYSLLEHSPAVLVVDRGQAVGIITKADVLKLMVKLGKSKPR